MVHIWTGESWWVRERGESGVEKWRSPALQEAQEPLLREADGETGVGLRHWLRLGPPQARDSMRLLEMAVLYANGWVVFYF